MKLKREVNMKLADKYFKYIYWSEEDNCFIGHCPELDIRIHRKDNNEAKLYKELCDVVQFHIEDEKKRGSKLPDPKLMTKKYSGKFIVRIDPELHRRLDLEAYKKGESINKIVAKKLRESLENYE